MDQKETVTVEYLEGRKITVVTINRPEARNAVNSHTAELLLKAFKNFDQDPLSQIAVFRGNTTFCAGFDLGEAAQSASSVPAAWTTSDFGRGPMGPSRLSLSKPVIGVVQGYAVAGGLELACWCDLLVSHPEAVFGVFCRRFGVPLIDGGTIRLVKSIGLNRARDMILTGRAVSGKELYQWGLVNRLASREKVFEQAVKLGKEIIVHPRTAMLGDRLSLMESVFPNLQRDLYNQFRIGMESLAKGETQKGAAEFKQDKKGRGGIFPKL